MSNENIFVIGLCGFVGSGKNTFSNFLVEKYGFKEFSFAEALKDVLSILFGWERELLEGKTIVSRNFREKLDERWSLDLKIDNFTPRKGMQMIGTELFRDSFHKDIWALVLKNKIINSGFKKIVITDCRFINEFEIIKNNFKNFYVFEISRWIPAGEEWYKELMINVNSDETYEKFNEKMEKNNSFCHRSNYEWKWALKKFKDLKKFTILNMEDTIEHAYESFEIKITDILNIFKDSCGENHLLVQAFSS